jgi:octaprenyl-diphosphate synthase
LPVQVRPRAPSNEFAINMKLQNLGTNFVRNTSSSVYRDLVSVELLDLESELKKITNSCSELTARISDYVINSGGKRIRPILIFTIGKIFKNKSPALLYLSVAIELIHAATLLHDDVIDESQLRRGKKTANNIWDNKSAILAGDYVFAESYRYMVKTKSLDVLKILSEAARIIADGEINQITYQKSNSFAYDEYLHLIKSKTAELFSAACHGSAVICSRSASERNMMKMLGHNLGMAFQIIDDYLDYVGDRDVLGKPIGKDFYEKKVTLPIILLIKFTNEYDKTKLIEFFQSDQVLNEVQLRFVLNLISKYNIENKLYDVVLSYITEVQDIIARLPQNDATKSLKVICENISFRKN